MAHVTYREEAVFGMRTFCGLIRWNRYGDLVRVSALDVAGVHGSHDEIVHLAIGNGVGGIGWIRVRGRVQLRIWSAGFRAAIHEVPCYGRAAWTPSECHSVLARSGDRRPGQSDRQRRIRCVARDCQCAGWTAWGCGIEIDGVSLRLAWTENQACCRTREAESATGDRHR